MSDLFNSGSMGNITLKNRVFMAPLTRNRAHADGTPSEMAVTYYCQRAGAGLIITEASQISAKGKGYLDTPGIYAESHVKAWKKITDAVHQEGGRIFIQLWHVGRISHTSLQPGGTAPVAPSAIRAKAQTFVGGGMVDVSEPKALTQDEIAEIVIQYQQATRYALEAGFDGVEIHAANGYLIDQFLQDKSNQREDAYGGSVHNRCRFLKEVVEAVLKVAEAGRVGVRLSPTGTFNDMGDSDPLNTFTTAIQMLNQYQLAYLHMVEAFPGIESGEKEKAILDKLRALWNGFYIANGGYERKSAIFAIASGHADAVAFGRPFIANPDLPERLRLNVALNEPDYQTFYGGDHRGYTDYPAMKDQAAA